MFGRKKENDWPFAVTNAAIRYRVAKPEFPGVENFDCGSEWWSKEVNDYVHAKTWADHAVIIPLEFGLDGDSIGFAFLALNRKPHPDSTSSERAVYQVVVYAGINIGYQGVDDPGSPGREHLSVTMFRGIEEHSRKLEQHPVGVWLQVRAKNTHAIKFYRLRMGFVDDSRGVHISEDKAYAPTIEMRKAL
jgi:hypothetical protein